MTIYPTMIFMKFMLPRVFGWDKNFLYNTDKVNAYLPHLARWFQYMTKNEVEFAKVRETIWEY